METLDDALEELKRVDHLIYVSLKYTRTVDVILNILNRMVDAYSLMVDALLEFAGDKVISEPESAVERLELVRQIYDDEDVKDNMDLYLLLRKLLRARHVVRENEYRRHVTMKTVVAGREEIVNIDIITNYFQFQREFIMHVKKIVEGVEEAEIAVQSFDNEKQPTWMTQDEEETVEREETVVHRTPRKRNTVKVRPVGSPPRKRAPRPKKYKIQIPKDEDSVTLPYEYDPHFRKEMEKEKARKEAEKKAKEAAQKAAKARRKKPGSKKKAAKGKSKKSKKSASKKSKKKAKKSKK